MHIQYTPRISRRYSMKIALSYSVPNWLLTMWLIAPSSGEENKSIIKTIISKPRRMITIQKMISHNFNDQIGFSNPKPKRAIKVIKPSKLPW